MLPPLSGMTWVTVGCWAFEWNRGVYTKRFYLGLHFSDALSKEVFEGEGGFCP